MIFSMLFLIFTFIDPNLAKNLTNLAEIVARLPPSVKWSGGQDWTFCKWP